MYRIWVISVAALMVTVAAWCDEIKHFTVPATAAGIRGDASLVYQKLIHPRNKSNYVTNSVFFDPDLPTRVVMIANNGDQTFDPVTRLEIPETDTHEVMVGLSNDGGDVFYFRRLLKWTNGLRMVRVVLVPDPARDRLWAGTAQIYENIPDTPAERFRGTTRIEVDWRNKLVHLLDQDGVGWDTYTLDTLNPPEPGYLDLGGKRITHIAEVSVNGQTRYEAWGSFKVVPAGATPPCAGSFYDANVGPPNNWNTRGTRIFYYRFDPSTGIDTSSLKTITSSVRTLPTSYVRGDMQVIRGELGNEEFLYVGTQDQIVCDEIIQQNTDGASVRFVKLTYNSQADNYDEAELDFLFDISNVTNPNWTCAESSVVCTGTTRNHYSLVSVVPYRSGGQIHLYANNWAGEVPTLPIIGEAGTVSVSHVPKVVALGRSYSEPVVFVQPPSFAGGQPAIARITNVQGSSFTVKIQEDTGLDGGHAVETLSYVVLERGTYRLRDRRVLEVDKVVTASTLPNTVAWTSQLNLKDSFGDNTGAVVFTQLQTSNDAYYAKTRHSGSPTFVVPRPCNPIGQCGFVTNAQVSFGIEQDEAAKEAGRQHGQETIGVLLLSEKWLARKSGIFTLGPFGASGFDVGRVPSVGGITNHGWTTATFEPPHLGSLANPIFLAGMETVNGGDPAAVRRRTLTPTAVELAVDEDQSADAERDHTLETLVYWVFGQSTGEIRAQPIAPSVDQMF